jgi:hypothetical protein
VDTSFTNPINHGIWIELINSIKDDLIYKKCKLDEIVDGNPSLVKSSNRSSKREIFFNEIVTSESVKNNVIDEINDLFF